MVNCCLIQGHDDCWSGKRWLLTTPKHLRDSLPSVLQKLIPQPSYCSHKYPTLLTLQATRHTSHLPENQKERTPAGLHRQDMPVPPGAWCWAGHSLRSWGSQGWAVSLGRAGPEHPAGWPSTALHVLQPLPREYHVFATMVLEQLLPFAGQP